MGDGREEEVGNQYVKEGGQGVAARNSPLLGAGKKKQDFSPLLQPISLTTKQSWSKTGRKYKKVPCWSNFHEQYDGGWKNFH